MLCNRWSTQDPYLSLRERKGRRYLGGTRESPRHLKLVIYMYALVLLPEKTMEGTSHIYTRNEHGITCSHAVRSFSTYTVGRRWCPHFMVHIWIKRSVIFLCFLGHWWRRVGRDIDHPQLELLNQLTWRFAELQSTTLTSHSTLGCKHRQRAVSLRLHKLCEKFTMPGTMPLCVVPSAAATLWTRNLSLHW
jgi:hypothetical protein